MIKVAIIGYRNRGKSTLNECLKSLYKEEEVIYVDDIDQLAVKIKEDNEYMYDLPNLKIIMLDRIKNLSKKTYFSLNQARIDYIKEDTSLLSYVELPKEKYDKDKLKKDNYNNKQKIKSYKR